jgi:hypothetical protein
VEIATVNNYNITIRQVGGGPSSKHVEVIDLTNPNTSNFPARELITRFENALYPTTVTTSGILSIASHLSPKYMWSPTPSLSIRRSYHPLEANLSQQTINTLITATQQHPNDVILFPTTNRIQNVTCGHLRELLSYGSMTGDSIINTYLDILCNARNIHHLSTFFTSILKRDKSWDAMTSWFAQDGEISPSKPKLTSDTILIPCHIHGAHWVGMVRRIINGRVTFLYADDLNLPTAETQIRHLIQTYTSPEFYPQNSIWINCTSISYRPHSNECGPQTLLALTILGIHPNPRKKKYSYHL